MSDTLVKANPTKTNEEDAVQQFKCFKCGLSFQTIQQLNGHKQNFCVGSEYGDVEKLRRKITRDQHRLADGVDTDVTFDDVTSYWKTKGKESSLGNSKIGSMSIADLRTMFQNSETESERIKIQVDRANAAQLEVQIKKKKKERQRMKAEQLFIGSDLQKALRNFEAKKMLELEKKIQIEKARQKVRGYGKTHLHEVENVKKRELQEITRRREQLMQQEDALKQEIEEVESKITETNSDFSWLTGGKSEKLSEDDGKIMSKTLQDQLHLATLKGERKAMINAERLEIQKKQEELNDVIQGLQEHKAVVSKDSPKKKVKAPELDKQVRLAKDIVNIDADLEKLATEMVDDSAVDVKDDSIAGIASGALMNDLEAMIKKQEDNIKALKERKMKTETEMREMQRAVPVTVNVSPRKRFGSVENQTTKKSPREKRKTQLHSRKKKKDHQSPSKTRAKKTSSIKRKKDYEDDDEEEEEEGDNNQGDDGDEDNAILSEIQALKEEYQNGGGTDESLFSAIQELEEQVKESSRVEQHSQKSKRKSKKSRTKKSRRAPEYHQRQAGSHNQQQAYPQQQQIPQNFHPQFQQPNQAQQPYGNPYLPPQPMMGFPQHPYGMPPQMMMGQMQMPGMMIPPSGSAATAGSGNDMFTMMLMQQMNQQEEMTRKLQKELEDARDWKRDNKTEKERKELRRMINNIAKIQASNTSGGGGGGGGGGGTIDTSHQIHHDWSELNEDEAVRKLETKFLIEKNKLKNKKELMQLQFEFQQFEQEMARKKKQMVEDQQHEDFVRKQKHEILKARLERLQLKESMASTENATYDRKPYNPKEGFVLCFDYATKLPSDASFAQIVYTLWDDDTQSPKTKPKRCGPSECEAISQSENEVIFHVFKQFKAVPLMQNLKLFIELQKLKSLPKRKGQAAKVETIGWSVLRIFNRGTENNLVLQQGCWRLPIIRGAANFQYEKSRGRQLQVPNIAHANVQIRVVNGRMRKSAEKANTDPQNVDHLYILPDTFKERERHRQRAPSRETPEKKRTPSPTKELESIKETKRMETPKPDKEENTIEEKEPSPEKEETNEKKSFGLQIIGISNTTEGPGENVSTFQVRTILALQAEQIQEGEEGKQAADDTQEQTDDASSKRITWITEAREPGTGEEDEDSEHVDFDFVWNEIKTFEDITLDLTKTDIMFELIDEVGVVKYKGSVPFATLLGEDQSTITYGPQTANLPDADESDGESEDAVIHFSLYDPASPPKIEKKKDTDETPEEEDEEEEEEEEDLVPGWKKGKPTKPSGKKFAKGDGFDFYVDGTRYLPDNVTLSKATLNAINTKMKLETKWNDLRNIKDVDKAYVGLCSVGHDPRASMYAVRAEYRADSFSPMTTLCVRVDAIDVTNKECRILGYAAINVFRKKGSLDLPSGDDDLDIELNQGQFQLPLFAGGKLNEAGTPFNANSLEKSPVFKRVPCATVLVRIKYAKKKDGHCLSITDEGADASSLIEPVPFYDDGSYDATRSQPSDDEKAIYEYLANREDMTIQDALKYIDRSTKFDDMEDEALLPLMNEKFSKPSEFMDMRYVARYQPNSGFYVKVNGVNGIKFPGGGMFSTPHHMTKVIYSLSPPHHYYQESKMVEDVFWTQMHDWDSPTTFPRFKDGWQFYSDKVSDESLCLILHVKCIKRNKEKQLKEIYDLGWSVLPIFKAGGYMGHDYIASGKFTLPLIEGTPTLPVLQSLEEAKGKPWEEVIYKRIDAKQLKLVPKTSIQVSLADGQILKFLNINQYTVTDYLREKNKFDLVPSDGSKKATLGTKIPIKIKKKKEEPSEIETLVNKTFAEITQLELGDNADEEEDGADEEEEAEEGKNASDDTDENATKDEEEPSD
eukprot:g1068.t1